MTAPVGIFAALPEERALLHAWLSDPRRHGLADGSGVETGMLDGIEVVLATSGIGKVAMASRATQVLTRFAPRAVLFSGVAGGLDPSLEVGDVVVGDRLIQHDAGVVEADGLATYQAGHLPFYDPSDRLGFEPDPRLLNGSLGVLEDLELHEVEGRRPRIVTGTILTGDVFVDSTVERRRLRETFGAAAVEMEGAALAQVCELFRTPCLVVRALSDLAGERAPSPEVFARFVEAAAANGAMVVRRLLPVV